MTDADKALSYRRHEAIASFKDLPRDEQVRQLQASGILGPDGKLAERPGAGPTWRDVLVKYIAHIAQLKGNDLTDSAGLFHVWTDAELDMLHDARGEAP